MGAVSATWTGEQVDKQAWQVNRERERTDQNDS
jgi:hypothetical protein